MTSIIATGGLVAGRRSGVAHSVRLAAGAAVLALGACAVGEPYQRPEPNVAPAWVAPVPHSGDTAALTRWWANLDDRLLTELVQRAQQRNASLQAAVARVEQARAQARAAGATGQPVVDAKSGVQRSATGIPPFGAPRTTGTLSADAGWEIDLFGGARAARSAALARVDARQAEWHDARTTLAAEVASTYVAYRTCEALVKVQTLDVASLRQTVALTQRKVEAGFSAPADAALLRASLANTSNQLIGQRAECDVLVKALVALTDDAEASLREQLGGQAGQLPQPKDTSIQVVPAQTLAQRPDLAAIERELAAAAADVTSAQADRYPKLTLTGTIGLASIRFGGATYDGRSWGFGPALSLPLFDAGRRQARVDANRARFDELRAQYMAKAVTAVREVEEALVRLDAAQRRQADAQAAVRDFETFLAASQSRWQAGLGNLIELEEARRQAFGANSTLIQLRRERVAQWINLYKALGGGWEPRPAIAANEIETTTTGSPR